MSHRIRTTAIAVALGFAASIGLAGPVAAESQPPASFFGMHYAAAGDGTWPQAKVGSIRLWDTGTAWRDLQPERDRWDFTRLDAAVANARSHGAVVSLVLGLTPAWASSAPGQWSFYGPGLAAPPRSVGDWWTYVHVVAARYAGQIESYEVWNEPNAGGLFFSGTTRELVRLARVARDAVKRADPAALLVSPSPVLRGTVGDPWLHAYAKAGGFRWADIVGVHNYPGLNTTVVQAIRNLDRVRTLLRGHGVSRPIWDTETNMDTNVTPGGVSSSPLRQAQLLQSYYRLAWRHGVARVGWYDWSATHNIGVRLASVTGSTSPSLAGQMFTWQQSNW